jgi:hypothetical protein
MKSIDWKFVACFVVACSLGGYVGMNREPPLADVTPEQRAEADRQHALLRESMRRAGHLVE